MISEYADTLRKEAIFRHVLPVVNMVRTKQTLRRETESDEEIKQEIRDNDPQIQMLIDLDEENVTLLRMLNRQPILSDVSAVSEGDEIRIVLGRVNPERKLGLGQNLREVDAFYYKVDLNAQRNIYRGFSREIRHVHFLREPYRSNMIMKWKTVLEDMHVNLQHYQELAENNWYLQVASLLNISQGSEEVVKKKKPNALITYNRISINTETGATWSDMKKFLEFAFQRIDAPCPDFDEDQRPRKMARLETEKN